MQRRPVIDHLEWATKGLSEAESARAQRACTAPVIALEPGPWCPPSDPARQTAWLGLLVIEGALTRASDVGSHRARELLGVGDLLRPWQEDEPWRAVTATPSWTVIEPAKIAVLDARFAAAAARFPSVTVAVVHSLIARSRMNMFMLALARVRNAEHRLMLLFQRLGDQWGIKRPEGVDVPLRLTHATIGDLVGLRRPTVTQGLTRLTERGSLERLADGTWRLIRPSAGG